MFWMHKLLGSTPRSSRQEVFWKIAVLKIFANFRGKHLCQSLFFKLQLMPVTLLKKKIWYIYFSVNFCKNFKDTFFRKTSNDCFYTPCYPTRSGVRTQLKQHCIKAASVPCATWILILI